MIKEKISKYWPILIICILIVLVLRTAAPPKNLLSNIDWPIPPFSSQVKEVSRATLTTWNDKYLLTGLPTPNPLFFGWFFIAFWGLLPISSGWLSLFNHFAIFIIAGLSSYALLKHYFDNKFAILIGSLFYMFSPPVFNWFHIGFVLLLYSYALIPLALLLFIKGTESKFKSDYLLILGLIYGIIGSIQTQSVFIWAMMFLGYAFFNLIFIHFSRERIKIYIKSFLTIFSIAFLINFYWILQILIGNSPVTQDSGRQIIETMLRLNSVTDFLQGFQLLGFHDPQYEGILFKYGFLGLAIPWIFTLFTWLVIVFRLDNRIKRMVSFFLILYLLSVSLTLGYNAFSPLKEIYGFFVKSSLLGLLFRGSYKFWLLGVISFTFLLTVAFDQITRKLRFRILSIGLTILTAILLFIPFYSNFVKTEEPYEWLPEYDTVNKWLAAQPGEFKAVFLPSETYIFLKDKKTHISDFPNTASPHTGSLGVANSGVTGNSYISYLNMIINEVPTLRLGEFLGLEGIKYVVFQDNVIAKSWEVLSKKGPVEIILKDKLSSQSDLEKMIEIGSLIVYENKKFQELVYPVINPSLVIGNFNYLLNSSNINNLVFLDSAVLKNDADVVNNLMSEKQSSIVFQDDSYIDFLLSNTDRYINVPLDRDASGYFNQDDWGTITNAYYFRNIDYTASLYNPVLAGASTASYSGLLKTSFKTIDDPGPYIILVKAYIGPRASKITFGFRDSSKEADLYEETIDTYSAKEKGFRWFKVENFPLKDFQKKSKTDLQFKIESFSGENAIERVVLIPQKEYLKTLEITNKIINQKKITISSSNFNEREIFIPKENDYNLSVNANDIANGRKLFVDNTLLDLIETKLSTKIHLKEGKHTFVFKLFNTTEIIKDPSFENGVWSGALDSNPNVLTPSFSDATLVGDAYSGNKSLQITTRSGDHAAAVCQAFNNLNNTSLYSFSFNYKASIDGSYPRFTFWQNLDKKNLPHWIGEQEGYSKRLWTVFSQNIILFSTDQWENYKGVLEPYTSVPVAGVCFFSDPWGAKINNILYDNVKIEEIPFGSVIIESLQDINSLSDVPEISFKKINSTAYEVIIKNAQNPFAIVLSESFNPNWQLISDGKIVKDHFKINGFANAWYLNKNGDYQVRIEFAPQKYYIFGIILSLVTTIGILIIIGVKIIRERK